MPVVKHGSERDQAKKAKDPDFSSPRNPDGSQYAKPAKKSKQVRPS